MITFIEAFAEYYTYQAFAHGKFALVNTVGALYPAITAVLLIIIYKTFPQFMYKQISSYALVRRFSAFSIIILGVYLFTL